MSMEVGVGTNASAKSPIHVVPICAMSGVVPPAIAVWYLLCAASHGSAVTLIFTPGFAASNAFANAGIASPSPPCAHMVIVPVAGPDAIVLAAAFDPLPAESEPLPVCTQRGKQQSSGDQGRSRGPRFHSEHRCSPSIVRKCWLPSYESCDAGRSPDRCLSRRLTLAAGAWLSHPAVTGTSAVAVRHLPDAAVIRGSGQVSRHR